MKLTEQEVGMGLIVVTCLCCDNVYKAHELSCSFGFNGLARNYKCRKCQGIKPEDQGRDISYDEGHSDTAVINETIEFRKGEIYTAGHMYMNRYMHLVPPEKLEFLEIGTKFIEDVTITIKVEVS